MLSVSAISIIGVHACIPNRGAGLKTRMTQYFFFFFIFTLLNVGSNILVFKYTNCYFKMSKILRDFDIYIYNTKSIVNCYNGRD